MQIYNTKNYLQEKSKKQNKNAWSFLTKLLGYCYLKTVWISQQEHAKSAVILFFH